jgi:hypothetical protein
VLGTKLPSAVARLGEVAVISGAMVIAGAGGCKGDGCFWQAATTSMSTIKREYLMRGMVRSFHQPSRVIHREISGNPATGRRAHALLPELVRLGAIPKRFQAIIRSKPQVGFNLRFRGISVSIDMAFLGRTIVQSEHCLAKAMTLQKIHRIHHIKITRSKYKPIFPDA